MEQLSFMEEVEAYQPRLQIYLSHVGATHKHEIKMGDFMRWIDRHMQMFRSKKKVKQYQPMTRELQEEFTEYLRGLEEKS